VALRLARDGYDIVLHCRARREDADSARAEIEAMGRAARILQFDISDRDASGTILRTDVAAHGAYYAVVCNAGLTADGPLAGMSGEDWDRVLRTNLDGFFNVLQPLIMPMIRRKTAGRIVVMSSVSGLMGNRGQVNYSAAKAGLIGAAKALAVELAKRQITVNCVAPGLIETEMLGQDLPVAEIIKAIPANRIGRPEEVAAVVSFLVSTESSYVTRQVIAVNGGLC
jgi:3-oxoacyl-[acyl-carrier protein] reductase